MKRFLLTFILLMLMFLPDIKPAEAFWVFPSLEENTITYYDPQRGYQTVNKDQLFYSPSTGQYYRLTYPQRAARVRQRRAQQYRQMEGEYCYGCDRYGNPQRSGLSRIPESAYGRRRGLSEPRRIQRFPRGSHTLRRGRNARAEAAPIWNDFITRFNRCEPGCVPTHYGTHGHRRNASCHHGGRALDLHSMTCDDGVTYTALQNSRQGYRFKRMVDCMEGLGMKQLFQNKNPRRYGVTQSHYDHAHFSMGCYDRGKWVY